LNPISDSGDALSAIASMAQMGRAANMQVILCEVPPMEGYTGLAAQIVAFNAALVNFAATNNLSSGGLLHSSGRPS
jgi:hypothetical protein